MIAIHYGTAGKKIYLIEYKTASELQLTTSELNKKKVFDFLEKSESSEIYFVGKNIEQLSREFSNYFKYIEAAGGLVRNKANKLLVIHRLGVPDFPKGKAEAGETPRETAYREVEEECGIQNLKLGKELDSTYHIYILKNKYVLKRTRWFEMNYSGTFLGTPQMEENITSIEWCSPHRLSELQPLTYETLRHFFV